MTAQNLPERFELFVLGDDEPKLEYTKDTKMTNAGTFVIHKEDHTLGNLLRMQLLRDPKVLFAGYRCPHPLKSIVEVKVRTEEGYLPSDAVTQSIVDLSRELRGIEDQLRAEVDAKKNPDQQFFDDL